ncbi:MAG: hypothetical protein E4H13_04390 [Calditrichales bacterium]|nr:MAG: hypothetical protein E4H13_04390 [Calditrichales bacterium]
MIRMCSGIWVESTTSVAFAAPGDSISVNTLIINRAGIDVKLRAIHLFSALKVDTLLNVTLDNNTPVSLNLPVRIPENAEFTSPYWLIRENNGAMFTLDQPQNIVYAQNPPVFNTRFELLIGNETIDLVIPVIYRWNDPIKGERQRPFTILPPVSVGFESNTQVFTNSRPRNIITTIQANGTSITGELSLRLPEGWTVTPEAVPFQLENNAALRVTFTVTASGHASSGSGQVIAKIAGKTYSQQISEIDYDHIVPQTVLSPATSRFIKLDMIVPNKQIGYIMGSGDEIPDALSQLGYSVTLLSDDDLEKSDLSHYQTIICGVRAFNTRTELIRLQDRLVDYVKNGGTWIVQHNTRFGNRFSHIGPIPFSTAGRDRISEEEAKITILEPDHPLMNYPNKITENDFSDWVQERGLYFADSWDPGFTPILSGNDTGEPAKSGGLLYAEYGNGIFIFTGYAWFRQLPAGVPGAYRIFVNLISAKAQGK